MKLKPASSKLFAAIFSLFFCLSLVLALPATTLANKQATSVQLKPVKAKISLEFQTPKNKKFDSWYKSLKADKQLKQVIARIIPIIGLNINIRIVFRDDSTGRGPYFDARADTIYFSYQFVQEFRLLEKKQLIKFSKRMKLKGETSLIWTKQEVASDTIDTTYRFIIATVYHELAHAIIFQMDFPIVGNEETAADDLSAVLIVTLNSKEEALDITLSTIAGLTILAQSENQLSDEHLYADTHAMGKDRQQRIICLVSAKLPEFSKKSKSYTFNYAHKHQAECKQAYEYQQKMWLGLLKHGYVPVKHSSFDGKISLEMKPATKPTDIVIKRFLESDPNFQALVSNLNKFLKLPQDIKLIYAESAKDSAPKIDLKPATIMIPYGYLANIAQATYTTELSFNSKADKGTVANFAFVTAMYSNVFLVNQQLAYLIMDFNQLPIAGSKLIAADNLATIILLNFFPDAENTLRDGIIQNLQSIAETSRKQNFLALKNKDHKEYARHNTQYDQTVKREYNILCLMLGKNPNKTLKILKRLKGSQKDINLLQEKKSFCRAEYKFKLKFWMRFLTQ